MPFYYYQGLSAFAIIQGLIKEGKKMRAGKIKNMMAILEDNTTESLYYKRGVYRFKSEPVPDTLDGTIQLLEELVIDQFNLNTNV